MPKDPKAWTSKNTAFGDEIELKSNKATARKAPVTDKEILAQYHKTTIEHGSNSPQAEAFINSIKSYKGIQNEEKMVTQMEEDRVDLIRLEKFTKATKKHDFSEIKRIKNSVEKNGYGEHKGGAEAIKALEHDRKELIKEDKSLATKRDKISSFVDKVEAKAKNAVKNEFSR